MSTHAPFHAKDHGANGANAVKHALTVRAMVPLARSRACTPSVSMPSMVANSAQSQMARLRRRSATTSAALWIASDHGPISLSAPPHAEMESRSAPITSAALPLMVVLNAHAVMPQATLWPAILAHALSIVLASGQRGRIAPRSVTVARRHPGSW